MNNLSLLFRKWIFLCAEQPKRGRRKLPEPDEASEEEESPTRWASLEEIAELPLGAPHKRILALLNESADLFQW